MVQLRAGNQAGFSSPASESLQFQSPHVVSALPTTQRAYSLSTIHLRQDLLQRCLRFCKKGNKFHGGGLTRSVRGRYQRHGWTRLTGRRLYSVWMAFIKIDGLWYVMLLRIVRVAAADVAKPFVTEMRRMCEVRAEGSWRQGAVHEGEMLQGVSCHVRCTCRGRIIQGTRGG